MVSSLADPTEKPLYVTGRWCEVLWNDTNDVIALTDWAGSNVSEIIVIDLRRPDAKRSLAGIVPGISQCLSADEREGHIYWEALEWEGPHLLQIRIFGHTDESEGHEFLYRFRVNIDSKTYTLLERQRDADDSAEGRVWDEKECVREQRQGSRQAAAGH